MQGAVQCQVGPVHEYKLDGELIEGSPAEKSLGGLLDKNFDMSLQTKHYNLQVQPQT